MSPTIDSGSTLGTLAAEQPLRIALFERLRLDYCCGGSTRLDDACARRGLDVDSVREQIEAVDRDGLRPDQPMPEWRPRDATVGELCEHVVSVHHERMREEMPRISELLETVVRVHGADHPDLEMVARTFASLRNELEKHIEEEELVLFPICRGLELGSIDPAGVEPGLIDRHRTEHEAVGRKLAALRDLAGGYELSQALCSTHRSLLERLRRFETDLHLHVHEENNVLLDRVGAMLDGPPIAGATTLDVLIETLVELGEAGRAERASRLAATAYVGLRRAEPGQAQRLNALMHKLILSPRHNDHKE